MSKLIFTENYLFRGQQPNADVCQMTGNTSRHVEPCAHSSIDVSSVLVLRNNSFAHFQRLLLVIQGLEALIVQTFHKACRTLNEGFLRPFSSLLNGRLTNVFLRELEQLVLRTLTFVTGLKLLQNG